MGDQVDTKAKQEQANPQGYEKGFIGKRRFLYLRKDDIEDAIAKYGKRKWYQQIWEELSQERKGVARILRYNAGIIIMCATVVNAVVAYYQWNMTHLALDRTAQVTQARIALVGPSTIPDWKPDAALSFVLRFKNAGQSAAFDVASGWGQWLCDGPPSEECASSCSRSRSPLAYTSPIIWGPQDPPWDREIAFPSQSKAILDAVREEKKTFYFCGIFTYQDTYRAQCVTHLCMYYSLKEKAFGLCPDSEERRDECKN